MSISHELRLQDFSESYSYDFNSISVMDRPDFIDLTSNQEKSMSIFTLPSRKEFTVKLETNHYIKYVYKGVFSARIREVNPKPLKPWKPSKSGTVRKYAGILSESIPALSRVSQSELDDRFDKLRKRE
jgi:hypothetical protein